MASRKEIAITIKGSLSAGGGGGRQEISFSKNGVSSAITSDDSANQETQKYFEGRKGTSSAGLTVTLYALNQVKNSIVQTASIAWNRYVDLKEDYLAQNNMNAIKTNLNGVKSYASAAIAGARLGSVAGPVGAAVGAAIGTIGNGVNRFINYKITMANYNEQNNAANAQTNFSRVRMGLIDGGRGTEN